MLIKPNLYETLISYLASSHAEITSIPPPPEETTGWGKIASVFCIPNTLAFESGLVRYQYKSRKLSSFQLAGLQEQPFDYFEVTIVNGGEQTSIAIGAAPCCFSSDCVPGWEDSSTAYHGYDGGIHLCGNCVGSSNVWNCGDTIGCGACFSPETQCTYAFWTLNGKPLPSYVMVPTLLNKRLWATIAMWSCDAQISIKIEPPFLFSDKDNAKVVNK